MHLEKPGNVALEILTGIVGAACDALSDPLQ
jgi:hypothetical protein